MALVELSAQIENRFLFAPRLVEVEAGLAKAHGFGDKYEDLCALDCLAAMHLIEFGGDIDLNEYIKVDNSGIIEMMFGIPTDAVGFSINDALPNDSCLSPVYGEYLCYFVDKAEVKAGDKIKFFFFGDSYFTDQACWFEGDGGKVEGISAEPGEKIKLKLLGYYFIYYGASPALKERIFGVANGQVGIVSEDGEIEAIEGALTGEEGEIEFSLNSPGEYLISATPLFSDRYIISPVLKASVSSQRAT